MGTAGHIDHGKTTLIEALTGIDCDTHKEEKKRGITIHLGFSHLDLSQSNSIGIVDVPGHRAFLHTMVGGVSGIDFVLLVIAADSGIMPQTVEHLQIMEVLGIEHGLIAITKSDLIDEEMMYITREDIQDFVKGSFLENSPIVEVSAKTGDGLDELKKRISNIASKVKNKSAEGFFRMYIDRIFTVAGFGTVVNGSVLNGKLSVDDKVYLLPGKAKELRIRRIERHGKQVSEVKAGDRASLNITGIEKTEFSRGMLISNKVLKPTDMLDAKMRLFADCDELNIWAQVIFHIGTYENQVKVHLIDKNVLKAGESGIVQIHLEEPVVIQPGDRFVLRNTSSDRTLGGGEVLDISPLHHRRRPEKLIKQINRIATGKLSDLIASQVIKNIHAVSDNEISSELNIPKEEIDKCVKNFLPKEIKKIDFESTVVFLKHDSYEKMRKKILKSIKTFPMENPFLKRGPTSEEILNDAKIVKQSLEYIVFKKILKGLLENGKVELNENKFWSLSGESFHINKDLEKQIIFISEYLKSCGMQKPSVSDLEEKATKRGLKKKDLDQIYKYLISRKEIYRIEDTYIHSSIVDSCRDILIKTLSKDKNGITVAQFRDIVQGNRKICLLLLNQYDLEKLTLRKGDLRFLN